MAKKKSTSFKADEKVVEAMDIVIKNNKLPINLTKSLLVEMLVKNMLNQIANDKPTFLKNTKQMKNELAKIGIKNDTFRAVEENEMKDVYEYASMIDEYNRNVEQAKGYLQEMINQNSKLKAEKERYNAEINELRKTKQELSKNVEQKDTDTNVVFKSENQRHKNDETSNKRPSNNSSLRYTKVDAINLTDKRNNVVMRVDVDTLSKITQDYDVGIDYKIKEDRKVELSNITFRILRLYLDVQKEVFYKIEDSIKNLTEIAKNNIVTDENNLKVTSIQLKEDKLKKRQAGIRITDPYNQQEEASNEEFDYPDGFEFEISIMDSESNDFLEEVYKYHEPINVDDIEKEEVYGMIEDALIKLLESKGIAYEDFGNAEMEDNYEEKFIEELRENKIPTITFDY
ncbi:hypothetical protein [Staphylococcus haemolyticus]|uniref:hypothetical protein n=1 Tax=Staphylococcus haemolyticus TaxID=1283 RepID=UPI001F0A2D64|nr:hypothetical protein [Staphylococcus haemolyticus]MCH4446781.1 hypothetical protein [Staphylococcus haemolyticus]